MAKRTAYDDLALLPHVLAEGVARQEYTGEEISVKLRDSSLVSKVEVLRTGMTEGEERLFCDLCDKRCQQAYAAQSKWFMKIVRMKDGRAQLENYLSHWMASFLIGGKKSISPRGSTK